jgi:hypothetical protein
MTLSGSITILEWLFWIEDGKKNGDCLIPQDVRMEERVNLYIHPIPTVHLFSSQPLL